MTRKKKTDMHIITLYFLKRQSETENKELKYLDFVYYSKVVNNKRYAIKSFDKKL